MFSFNNSAHIVDLEKGSNEQDDEAVANSCSCWRNYSAMLSPKLFHQNRPTAEGQKLLETLWKGMR